MQAARIFGFAEAALFDPNVSLWAVPTFERDAVDRGLAALRDVIDAGSLARARAEGRELTEDEAVEAAMEMASRRSSA